MADPKKPEVPKESQKPVAKAPEAPKAPDAPLAPAAPQGEPENGQSQPPAPTAPPAPDAPKPDTSHHPKAPVLVHGGEVKSDSAARRQNANSAMGFMNSVKVTPAVNAAAQKQHGKVKKV